MNNKMIRFAACAFALTAALVAGGCSGSNAGGQQGSAAGGAAGSAGASQATHQQVTVNASPDKYTWYVKDYYGMNAANCGYTALSGDRMDKYGAAAITMRFQTADGTYVDPQSEADLKQYAICGQNVAPNTEIKLTFDTDSSGKEYDNLVAWSSLEEIVLAVKKVGEADTGMGFATIAASPDKYTWYVRDYVGRNLANCGYTSLAGKRADGYGAGWVTLELIATDGSFVDPKDKDALKNYRVVGQSVAPNTEITFTFTTDSSGKEYNNLVSTKSLDSIELRVERIG